MITIQVIPKSGFSLRKNLKLEERERREKDTGTFKRVKESKGWVKWEHTRYPGWVWFNETIEGILSVEINSRVKSQTWQILSAFVGYLHRRFENRILAINIQYW